MKRIEFEYQCNNDSKTITGKSLKANLESDFVQIDIFQIFKNIL